MQRYVWVAAALYFAVDTMLLLGVNLLCGFPQNYRRILLAATMGALYTLMCLKPGFHFLGNLLWRTVSLVLTAMVAFGMDGSALRRGLVFGILHLAMLGIQDGGKDSFWQIVLAASTVYLLSLIGFGGGVGKRYLPIRIEYGGKTACFTALVDTGNSLRDPMTGQSVLIVSPKVAETLLNIPIKAVLDPILAMESLSEPGLRIIPYHTVGNPSGLLLAMRFANVRIGEKTAPQIVAFSPQPIGEGQSFQALAGGIV